MSCFLNPWSTLLYVTKFVAVTFGFTPECIPKLFFYRGDGSVVTRSVYRGFVVSFYGRETLIDLIELDMINLNSIFGIDWLHLCYASLDFITHKVIFKFPNELVILWEEGSSVPKERLISYLRFQKLISKGCFYYLVWVK